jgi:hypothetical protein
MSLKRKTIPQLVIIAFRLVKERQFLVLATGLSNSSKRRNARENSLDGSKTQEISKGVAIFLQSGSHWV